MRKSACTACFSKRRTQVEQLSKGDYEKYKSAILAANDSRDKEALRQIQKQLIAKYTLDNPDVRYLLKLFAYNV